MTHDMTRMIRTTTAALLLMLSGLAAAQSMSVQVRGFIKPDSCVPKLGDTAGIDYRVIDGRTLSVNEAKFLGRRSTTLTIDCPSAMTVRLKVSDTRAASALSNAELPGTVAGHAFGLGRASGAGKRNAKIGAYTLTLDADSFRASGNGLPLRLLRQSGRGWVGGGTGRVMRSGDVFSWGQGMSDAPGAFTKLSGTLHVDAYVNKLSDLPLDSDIQLDGLATLEMIYQ